MKTLHSIRLSFQDNGGRTCLERVALRVSDVPGGDPVEHVCSRSQYGRWWDSSPWYSYLFVFTSWAHRADCSTLFQPGNPNWLKPETIYKTVSNAHNARLNAVRKDENRHWLCACLAGAPVNNDAGNLVSRLLQTNKDRREMSIAPTLLHPDRIEIVENGLRLKDPADLRRLLDRILEPAEEAVDGPTLDLLVYRSGQTGPRGNSIWDPDPPLPVRAEDHIRVEVDGLGVAQFQYVLAVDARGRPAWLYPFSDPGPAQTATSDPGPAQAATSALSIPRPTSAGTQGFRVIDGPGLGTIIWFARRTPLSASAAGQVKRNLECCDFGCEDFPEPTRPVENVFASPPPHERTRFVDPEPVTIPDWSPLRHSLIRDQLAAQYEALICVSVWVDG